MNKNKKWITAIGIIIVFLVLVIIFLNLSNKFTTEKYGYFVKGPDMHYARSGILDAIKLKDGRVLVLGHNRVIDEKEERSHWSSVSEKRMLEIIESVRRKDSEIYNPKTNTFNKVDFGKDFYYSSLGLLLKDGKVLLTQVFTYNNGLKVLDKAKMAVYNPYTNNIESIIDKKIPRGGAYILLNDGKVLITNGSLSNCESGPNYKKCQEGARQAELYDPVTNAIKLVGKSDFYRSRPIAVLLDDGKVLIAGNVPQAELYNPKTENFETVGSLKITRDNPILVKLDSDRVLVLGGKNSNGTDYKFGYVQEAEIYNVKSKKFEIVGKMTTRRGNGDGNDFTATLLDNGKVLIVGGMATKNDSLFSNYTTLKSAEIYDSKTNKFMEIANLKQRLCAHAAVLLDNGDVLIIGGNNSHGSSSIKSTRIFKVRNKK